jgi:hypothetical protein
VQFLAGNQALEARRLVGIEARDAGASGTCLSRRITSRRQFFSCTPKAILTPSQPPRVRL